ncbi:MAG: nucleotide sugar dehydrogenase [Pseudomonadales bacterium]|nr:nucleotide sugar dehydrogenase [Pseudomonadales bacterium]
MKIAVLGLGYVGVVSAACFAKLGHEVTGIDVLPQKVESINDGFSPIIEVDIGELIEEMVKINRLRATTNIDSVLDCEVIIVCVGTPSDINGRIDLSYVTAVVEELGEILKDSAKEILVVIRSTIVPGSMKDVVCNRLESSLGADFGRRVHAVFHPEFLREGTSVWDFFNPPKIVIGELVPGSAEKLISLYSTIDAPRFITTLEVAEMVKYADNAFHAVKVTFANEIGGLCKAFDVDSRIVMEMFCADTKLNISSKYLRPGNAFGGSCLPKDLRAIMDLVEVGGSSAPMLTNVISSNSNQIKEITNFALEVSPLEENIIGLVGLAFKEGTDDLRESPLVIIVEALVQQGRKVLIHDDFVQQSRLVGKNKSYVDERLPHVAKMLTQNIEDLDACSLIVIGHKIGSEVIKNWLAQGIEILDLVGDKQIEAGDQYHGLYW